MNDKDREVLEALTDDSHYTRYIEKVEAYARNKAFALGISQDAALYARDKVTDWLMKREKVEYPASYVNAIIRNALKDYVKTNKSTDDITQMDLAALGYEDEGGRIGWRVLKTAVKPRKNVKKESLLAMSESRELVMGFQRVLDLTE
jgi:DNA-directed RNA polymerase specialized sigma24 family protein